MVTHEFPYTNLHDLNIDWILKVVKDFQEKYTDFGQAVTDSLQQITDATNESLETLENALGAATTTIENAKLNAINDLNTEKASILDVMSQTLQTAITAVETAQEAAVADVGAEKDLGLTSLRNQESLSIAAINSAYNQGVTRLQNLIATFPLDDAQIIGQLQIINSILNGTDALTVQWQQGTYDGVSPYDWTTTPNTVSSVRQAGCSGRKLHVKANTTGHLITYIYYWTGNLQAIVSNPIGTTETTFIFPSEATYFSVLLGTNMDMATPINLADVTATAEWIVDGVVRMPTLLDYSQMARIRNLYNFSKLTITNGKIDVLNALRKIPNKTMTVSLLPSTTVTTFEQVAINSQVATLHEALRVRDTSGNLITPIYCYLDPEPYQSANLAFGYKQDGTPDRAYKAVDVVNNVLTIDATTYFLVFLKFSTLELKVLTDAPTVKNTYNVGAGQEYTTLHSCLTALKDDKSEKIINIYGGTYDIIEELGGASFIAGLSASDNWYDVNDIIPPNTHLIGHGNVIINMTIPAGTASNIAVLLSPINMMGSAEIENLTINCDGGRYCVHAEGGQFEEFNNATWKITNCIINKTNNLSGTPNAIGSGVNDGGYFIIKNCIITNDGNTGLLVHDQQAVAGSYNKSPKIFVENCAFNVSAYPIVMSSTHSGSVSGAVLEVVVTNCYCNNKFMRKIGTGNKDVFHVTYINTPHRTQNGAGLVDIIPDTEYNNFSLT